MSKFTEQWKSTVEKPGASTHSEKWDRCVEHVKSNGNGANAYAVCTSMLGEESFKSIMTKEEYTSKMDEYMRKLGISGAGPVPESLLADQDLEDEALKFQKAEGTFAVWYYDKLGAKRCAVFPAMEDAEAYCRLINNLGYKKIEVLVKVQTEKTETWTCPSCGKDKPASQKPNKDGVCNECAQTKKGQFDSAGKRLSDAVDEADMVTTGAEVEDLATRIKNIQIARQKGQISARAKEGDAVGKTFKQIWNEGKK